MNEKEKILETIEKKFGKAEQTETQVPEKELDDITKARKWYEEAEIMWGQGRSLDALERYEEALKIFLENKLWREAANAAEKIGDVKFWRERYEEALKPYKMAMDICEEFNDEISAALMAEKIIYTYQKLDQPEKALPYFYRTLEIAEKFGDAHRAARSMVGIGDIQKYRGDFQAALEAYEIALKIYKGLGSLEQAQLVQQAIDSLRKELDTGKTSS
ncbi:Tetratricopeptide TPR_1 repeat-containing protein [Thermodesulfatator indicus DSM 15286]|uniref:Tetratricopeptide TPR_1 repeat-containing protein n=1 Tax=Thermodesulfatator indicus (strain DSM 15286 / JCM 11887 / CIR29812) TaxID=667014 RepID=F8A8Z6_THEID|nr:tetratricopeptide repeat protein [Thermodesulfatator indicus]AEH44045.1 Tetratricopeptide TPR_1 repeat-containing protein [Thermodesulfatator indicus DSM 15286]